MSPGTAPFDLRAAVGATSGEKLVVLPAGVRPVKAPRFAIAPLERLRARVALRYVVLGPVLDPEEGRLLADELATRPWCARVEVEPGAVAAALAGADLVLNTSRAEGFSNAIAEAMSVGSAVLAVDVPGNRLAVGRGGVLFSGEVEFEARAEELLVDDAARAALGERARDEARRRFDPARETDALLEAYAAAIATPRRRARTLPLA